MNVVVYPAEAEIEALATMPLEALLRGVSLERVVSRLRTERSLFAGGVLSANEDVPFLTVIVIVERECDDALKDSLTSIALQSCPFVRCVVVPARGVNVELLEDEIQRSELLPKDVIVVSGQDQGSSEVLRDSPYLTFLRQGDQLHPSAAAWLSTRTHNDVLPDVVLWGSMQMDKEGGIAWARHRAGLDREMLLHAPYASNAFAIASRLIVGPISELVDACLDNEFHLLLIQVIAQRHVTWIGHPEIFLIHSSERPSSTLAETAHLVHKAQASAYPDILRRAAPDFVVQQADQSGSAPYHLVPKRRAASVSVLILFRDQPELTLTAVLSVVRQKVSGALDIVLMNNQSTPQSVNLLRTGLGELPNMPPWRIVDYDRPFNHSDQCNRGIELCAGEVVIILNNDCELVSYEAVELMAAWALQDGVASVGLAIENPETQEISAGMALRSASGPFDSIVEERSHRYIVPFVHECFGNTFACAAVSRRVYSEMGGLDAFRFPNGFNDVDFACRTLAAGMKHLVLGHLRARHAPGQSRSRTDETPQKMLIRSLYPQLVNTGRAGVVYDDKLADLARPKAASPTSTRAGRVENAAPTARLQFWRRLARKLVAIARGKP